MFSKCVYNRIFSTVFIVCFFQITHAQLEADYWMFSPHRYVYFNHASNPDTARYPVIGIPNKGTVSYSDRNGNFLFFATTGIVYDRNFQIFPSLDIAQGGLPLYSVFGTTPSQPMLGIPYPGHDSLYIIFHIRSDFNNQYKSSLYHSVINMNLRGGLGEIVSSQKNIQLLNGVDVAYKLTAILHCNKRDVWVLGHFVNSDQYFSLLVTPTGISTAPQYFTGTFVPNPAVNSNHPNNFGCVKISALGNKLASAFQGLDMIELFDFNTQTGIGSNLKRIKPTPPPQDTMYIPWYAHLYGPIGVDFSPSGNKLYTTSNYNLRNFINSDYGAFIHQFDASLPTEALIQNSQFELDEIENNWGGAIQIANNAKMYINIQDALCEIASPEINGTGCNYTRFSVPSGFQYPNTNLPSYLQSYFRYPVIATRNCQFQNISFNIENPVGVASISWNFGDPASGVNNSSTLVAPTHIFSSQGAYTVTAVLQNANGCLADTIRKVVYAGQYAVFLGNDTTICRGDTLRLRTNIPNAVNLWSNGSRDTIIKVTQSGTYWVRTNIGECVASDTINVTVRSLPAFTLGSDTTICSNQPISLSPNPNPPGVSYSWNTGAATATISTISDGLYWVRVTENGYGCRFTDSINIRFRIFPNYNLGPDTSMCAKDTVTLDASVTGATGYLWNTGASSPIIKVHQTGIYWADVAKDGCVYRDSVAVLVKPLPIVNIGSDSTLCEDQTLLLNAQNPGSSYLWQNGPGSQTFNVINKGVYYVKVTNNGCLSSDTIVIDYMLRPRFSLGPDRGICIGQEIVLSPGTNNVSYLWQNGSSSRTFTINDIGLYYVDISNRCGITRDSIIITKGICDLYVPSGFTPNNDGKNDILKVLGDPVLKEFRFTIFNRWGEIVFDTKDKNKGWDGRVNSILQPNGVYVWMIRYEALIREKQNLLKGTVTLLR